MSRAYKARFTIQDDSKSGIALLDDVEQSLRDWAQPRFGEPLKDAGKWDNGTESIEIDAARRDDQGYFNAKYRLHEDARRDYTLTAVERDIFEIALHPPLEVRCNYTIATVGGEIENVVRVDRARSLNGTHDSMYAGETPDIVRHIVQRFNCYVESDRLNVRATEIGNDEIETFVNDQLFGARALPIVLVSQQIGKDPVVDADDLQRKLLGNFRVFTYKASTASAMLGYMSDRGWGRRLACSAGDVRLYKPGANPNSPASDHPCWRQDRIQDIGIDIANRILASFRRHEDEAYEPKIYRASYLFVTDDRYAELRNQLSEEATQNKKLKLLVDQITTSLDDAQRESTAQEATLQAENKRLEASIGELETTIEELTHKVETLALQLKLTQISNSGFIEQFEKAELKAETLEGVARRSLDLADRLSDELNTVKADNDDDVSEQLRTYEQEYFNSDGLKSVKDAVYFADVDFKHLRFLPSALKSAANTQYRSAEKLYQTFKTLNECAGILTGKSLHKGSLGMSMQDFLKHSSIDYVPGESETTTAKYAADRYFSDDKTNKQVYMPAHIRMGKNIRLRIHLRWEPDEGKWLIGHVGEHLRTSRN